MIVQRFLKWIETAPAGRRAEATRALARAYLYSDVDEDTRYAMEAAMTVLLDDPSPEVRFALAEVLGAYADVPRHILFALAAAQPEIAANVLSRSPVFIDAELVDIAAAGDTGLQVAIASREDLSAAVAAAVAEVGDGEACRALIANTGAAIARISLQRMAERFGDEPDLRGALLSRGDLPADVRQLLIRRLSAALGELGVVKAWVGADRAEAVTREACDRATVALAAETATEELVPLVEHLRVTGQLTTALLLRAVCAGNVPFLEAALSVLARVPEARVASLVRSGRPRALRAVYDKAGLPAVAFDAFVAAIETAERFAEEGERDRYRFSRRMVESVIARYQEITDGEMNELTSMLRRFAADQAREAARAYARTAVAAA